MSYAVVVPGGVSWPPVTKDDDTIYTDMLQLGAQLKECAINLGDGGSPLITISIEQAEE